MVFPVSSVQSLSCVRLFVTSWTSARQASLSITNSRNLLKLVSIGLVMPSNHLILCRPFLFPPSIFPSIRVFSNEPVLTSGFSSSHVWMLELDYKESWVLKNWCFWTVVLEKALDSPLDCKEIQPAHPKGTQSWIFIGRTDAEAETPVLWTLDKKNWLIWKDPDAGKDWGQEEKGTTEDEMVGWHHNSIDMSLSKLRRLVMDRNAGVLQFMGFQSQTWLSNWTELNWISQGVQGIKNKCKTSLTAIDYRPDLTWEGVIIWDEVCKFHKFFWRGRNFIRLGWGRFSERFINK